MNEVERQCSGCGLPEYPEGTKLTHGMCRGCMKAAYPEFPSLHNVADPDGTFYVQTN